MVTGQASFSGYKNLKRYDKEGACQMEVGRSGDFSTPATKGKASINKRKEDMAKYKQECTDGGNASWTGLTKGVNEEEAGAAKRAAQAAHAAAPEEEKAKTAQALGAATNRLELAKTAKKRRSTGANAAWVKDGVLVTKGTPGATYVTEGGAALKGKAIQGETIASNGKPRGRSGGRVLKADISAYRTPIGSFRYRTYVKSDGTVRTSAEAKRPWTWYRYKDVRRSNGGNDILGLKPFDSNGTEQHLSYPSDDSGTELSGFLGLSGSSRLDEKDLRKYAATAAAAAST